MHEELGYQTGDLLTKSFAFDFGQNGSLPYL
jgi:hypothetical protein